MRILINNYNDLKALAIINGIKIQTELPSLFGYKSRWGLKLAMRNNKTKNLIIEKAKIIFDNISYK